MAEAGSSRPGQCPGAIAQAMRVSPDARSTREGATHATSAPPCTLGLSSCEQGSPGAHVGLSNACAQHDMDMYIAHMRQHEYPQFMSLHMSQGVPRDQAHSMYSQWESMRVEQRIRDMNTVPT